MRIPTTLNHNNFKNWISSYITNPISINNKMLMWMWINLKVKIKWLIFQNMKKNHKKLRIIKYKLNIWKYKIVRRIMIKFNIKVIKD